MTPMKDGRMQRERWFAPKWVLAGLLLMLAATISAGTARAQSQAEASNMELVGHSDLQGRAAYQPTIHKQGDRWIAYVGHHGGEVMNPLTGKVEPNGTSILDVTDPAHPKYLAHIPGEPPTRVGGDSGGAQMVRVCDGSELPHADKGKVYMLRTFGNSAQEIWDVTNPADPTRLTVVLSGLKDAHKNWWECDTGIAYLVAGDPQWRVRRMMKIYDLSDPAKPVFIRDFGLPGQQPGATGPLVLSDLHGPISTGPKGNRVYMAYGPGGHGVVQILDREKLLSGPKEPTDANLLYPQIARINFPDTEGAHTAYPLLGMNVAEFAKDQKGQPHDFLIVPGEELSNECQGPAQFVHIFNITDEARPIGISTWNVPEASGNFCSKGGRFGSHSVNENFTPIYYKRLVFVSFFNAGVRALDIRDPYHPKEVGYYIPATNKNTSERCTGKGAERECKVVIQTNNVDVDDRGYIYIADRANTGLDILQLTGPARAIANLP
jgi:hypothetical protein